MMPPSPTFGRILRSASRAGNQRDYFNDVSRQQGSRVSSAILFHCGPEVRPIPVPAIQGALLDSGDEFLEVHFRSMKSRCFSTTRHLSLKAATRSMLLNALPNGVARWIMNIGWKYQPGINLEFAGIFKKDPGVPVIANGGFQEKDVIEGALDSQRCDIVSMARALIANPNLLDVFMAGKNVPDRACSHCNRCVGRTVTSPLGCDDEKRFASIKVMQDQIMAWNRPDPA
jgi:tRNA-dihydrouridine synthase